VSLRRPEVGIHGFGVHIPEGYLEVADLADARGWDRAKLHEGLGLRRFAVPLDGEDSVSMAAQACRRLIALTELDRARIALVVVGTETAVDGSKPIASYLQGLLGLPDDAMTLDVQHACFGATGALDYAALWAMNQGEAADRAGPDAPEGRVALVVASDIARYRLGSAAEPTQGAGAVAMLVAPGAGILRLRVSGAGVASADNDDFLREPGEESPQVDGKRSTQYYLEALHKSYARFVSLNGERQSDAARVLVHAPYPSLAVKAHAALVTQDLRERGEAASDQASLEADAEARLWPGLSLVREVGNAYSASLYLQLARLCSLPDTAAAAGSPLALFSFGSGYVSRFTFMELASDFEPLAPEAVGFGILSKGRRRLSVAEYGVLRGLRWDGCPDLVQASPSQLETRLLDRDAARRRYG
jgi:hydroxymethylglutaryl-CoA synthase